MAHHYQARKAWSQYRTGYDRPKALQKDFSHGWKQGYFDTACGGNGAPPPVPPECYWKPFYQTPDGRHHVDAWYQGYQYGCIAADQDGVQQMAEIPTAPGLGAPPPRFWGAVPPPSPNGEEVIPAPQQEPIPAGPAIELPNANVPAPPAAPSQLASETTAPAVSAPPAPPTPASAMPDQPQHTIEPTPAPPIAVQSPAKPIVALPKVNAPAWPAAAVPAQSAPQPAAAPAPSAPSPPVVAQTAPVPASPVQAAPSSPVAAQPMPLPALATPAPSRPEPTRQPAAAIVVRGATKPDMDVKTPLPAVTEPAGPIAVLPPKSTPKTAAVPAPPAVADAPSRQPESRPAIENQPEAPAVSGRPPRRVALVPTITEPARPLSATPPKSAPSVVAAPAPPPAIEASSSAPQPEPATRRDTATSIVIRPAKKPAAEPRVAVEPAEPEPSMPEPELADSGPDGSQDDFGPSELPEEDAEAAGEVDAGPPLVAAESTEDEDAQPAGEQPGLAPTAAPGLMSRLRAATIEPAASAMARSTPPPAGAERMPAAAADQPTAEIPEVVAPVDQEAARLARTRTSTRFARRLIAQTPAAAEAPVDASSVEMAQPAPREAQAVERAPREGVTAVMTLQVRSTESVAAKTTVRFR